MKINKKYIILFFILQWGIQLYSQTANTINATSPNSSSMEKEGALPVGPYAGRVAIQMPLYELELDKMKMPIGLSYDASGIKVMQEASSIGLGWTLIAGGTIVQEVKRIDDLVEGSLKKRKDFFLFDNDGILSSNDNVDIKDVDTQPDLFHFNFGSYHCTAFFDLQAVEDSHADSIFKPIVINPTAYLDISFNQKEFTWTIIDQFGYKYFFASREKVTSYMHQRSIKESNDLLFNINLFKNKKGIPQKKQNPYSQPTWYLDFVESPIGNKIVFHYDTEKFATPVIFDESMFANIPRMSFLPNIQIDEFIQNYSYFLISQKRLQRIDFPGGYIILDSSDRKDLEPFEEGGIHGTGAKAKKIDRIRLLNSLGEPVKQFDFSYSYMGDSTQYDNCRLMLNSFTENKGNKYTFSYNPGILPDKNSWTTDLWGFYNGPLTYIGPSSKNTFTTLPPVVHTIRNTKNIEFISGKNIIPNPLYMQYGILDKITYPTGGATQFIYGTHQFDNHFLCSYTQKQSTFGETVYHPKLYTTPLKEKEEIVIGKEFVLDKSDTYELSAKYDYDYSLHKTNSSEVQKGYMTICIEKKTSSGFTEIKKYEDVISQPIDTRNRSESLSSGTYRIVFKRLASGTLPVVPQCNFMVQVSIERTEYQSYDLDFGGGLRIEEIKKVDNNNNVLSKKVYKYDSNGESNGLLLSKPDLAYLMLLNDSIGYRISEHKFNIGYISSSSSNNPNVGYSYVEEMNIDRNGETIGKTTYKYKLEPNNDKAILPDYPNQLHIGNGSLLQCNLYNKEGQILRATDYSYSQQVGETDKTTRGLALCEVGEAKFGSKYYDLKSERWTLDQELITDYRSGSIVQTKINYTYSDKNWLPYITKSVNSNNQSMEIITKFPFDFSDDISKKMVAKKMMGVPIETLNLFDNLIISGEKKSYREISGLILPKEELKLNLLNPIKLDNYSSYYQTKSYFDKYTNKGKLLNMVNKEDIPIYYLWSYNGQYPIAEIKGGVFSDVEASLKSIFGVADANALSVLSKPNEIKLKDGSLQKALPNSIVTTYTYKPLVGITTITNPSGVTMYYNYDLFSRLQEIYKIENNVKKVIESYDYNYKSK